MAEKHVRGVQDMCEESETVVNCVIGFEVRLHQLALSPFLFELVMNRLTDEVKQDYDVCRRYM